MSSALAGPSSSKKTKSSKSKTPARVPTPPSESDNESVASADSEDIDDDAPVSAPAAASSSKRTTADTSRGRSLARYQPPAGMEPVNVSVAFGSSPFEFGSLARKAGVELWAIRVPSDFKTSRLANLSLQTPGDSVRGELTSHGKTYALGADTDSAGAEMAGLTLLVPNVSAGGKLQRAPVKISRRLILSPGGAGGDKADEATDEYVAPAKAKRVQPEHLLKFRNRVSGFDTPGPAASGESSEVAAAPAEVLASPKKSKDKDGKDKDGKRKKRKSGADEASPSKKKKKTADE
ncbi:uncharacterized protein LOC62_06G008218 [Vanrija pseudolonga]|uniref:DNA-directed RNA polymerase I subunit RPA34.5 n=1 Tax=Vanrija pseudolonga TaxID=143232 RepID=A0AAF1BKI8_9TREE|nr:hypothetical protein LOC62_06G008218 [Vanrija pseudolonga]